jgi:hypothetical protein
MQTEGGLLFCGPPCVIKEGLAEVHWTSCHFLKNAFAICVVQNYRGADKSLARPTSRCILFDGENILFDASLVVYI